MKRKDFSNLNIEVKKEKHSYFKHEDFIAGTPPFLRGNTASMYFQNKLDTYLDVNTSSITDANKFLINEISKNRKHFVLNFTSTKNDTGIYVTSVDQMRLLLDKIPLDKIKFNLKSKDGIFPFFTLFLATAKSLNFKLDWLNISVEHSLNNATNNFIFQPNKQLPNLGVSLSIKTEETNSNLEPANLLYNTQILIKNSLLSGTKIDDLASLFSIQWKAHQNLQFEISKLRAARLLWANMMKSFNPKKQESLAAKIHIDCDNKVLPAFAAIAGSAQSITSSNAISNYLTKEAYVSKTIDPFAGSTFLEQTTEEFTLKNWKHYLELIKNDTQISNINKNKANNLNFIALALEASEKRTNLEGILKFLKKQ